MLVFIHGLNGTRRELSPFHRALGQHMPVCSPALLGHDGRPFDPGGFEAIVDDLVGQLDQLGARPVFLFGYSFGGTIALDIARRHPDRVAGIILFGARVLRDEASREISRYLYSPERVANLSPEKRVRLEKHYGGPEQMQRAYARSRAVYDHVDSSPTIHPDGLKSIKAPVLLISGDKDDFAPIGYMKALAGLLPDARTFTFPGTAHPVHRAPVGELIGLVSRFLRYVNSRPKASSPAGLHSSPILTR